MVQVNEISWFMHMLILIFIMMFISFLFFHFRSINFLFKNNFLSVNHLILIFYDEII